MICIDNDLAFLSYGSNMCSYSMDREGCKSLWKNLLLKVETLVRSETFFHGLSLSHCSIFLGKRARLMRCLCKKNRSLYEYPLLLDSNILKLRL